MAHISVDQRCVLIETGDFGQLWQSRLEIPLTHILRTEVVRDAAERPPWLRLGPLHSAEMAGSGTFLRDGRDVFCDVRDPEQVVVIHLRDNLGNNPFDRLFVQVNDPQDAVERIERAIQSEQLPANALAFLLGVLETQESVAEIVQDIWENNEYRRLAPTTLSPTEVTRTALGEDQFEGARAAGRTASLQIELAGHANATTRRHRLSATVMERGGFRGIRLSSREHEVLGLVAEGCSNQSIAESLSIAERTARYHVTSIFNKLGADNRAHAVALAAQRGLLA